MGVQTIDKDTVDEAIKVIASELGERSRFPESHPLYPYFDDRGDNFTKITTLWLATCLKLVSSKKNYAALKNYLIDSKHAWEAIHILKVAAKFVKAGLEIEFPVKFAGTAKTPDFVVIYDNTEVDIEVAFLYDSEMTNKIQGLSSKLSQVLMNFTPCFCGIITIDSAVEFKRVLSTFEEDNIIKQVKVAIKSGIGNFRSFKFYNHAKTVSVELGISPKISDNPPMCKDIDAFNVWFHSVFGENAETFCGFSLNYDYRDLERVIYNKIKNEKTQLRRTKIQGLVVLVNKGYYARSGVLYATEQWHGYVNSILANHSRPFGIVIYDEFGGVCEEKLVSIGDNGLYVSKLLNETLIRLYEQALIVFNKGALDQSNEDFRDKVTAAFTKT